MEADRVSQPSLAAPPFGGRFFEKSERGRATSCKIEFTKQPITPEVTDVSLRIIVAMDGVCVK